MTGEGPQVKQWDSKDEFWQPVRGYLKASSQLPVDIFGQIENRWQPDSIYSNRQVKKIFVYLLLLKMVGEKF